MFRSILKTVLGERRKRFLRAKLNATKVAFAKAFHGYDVEALQTALRQAGVGESDSLMVHANFPPDSGFLGSPGDLVDGFAGSVCHHGNLLMVSIPFRGFAYDHLDIGKLFNVRKSMSMMGLVTEVFRRKQGVLRSLHPSHPILALGKDSAIIVAGHERSLYPTAEDSPFAKLVELDGKVLLYDVGFGAITLFHHVEHLLRDRLAFPLYDERLFAIDVIDADGNRQVVKTYAFARGVRRYQSRLEAEMTRRGKLKVLRIGNSRGILVRAKDVVATMTEMIDSGAVLLERAAPQS